MAQAGERRACGPLQHLSAGTGVRNAQIGSAREGTRESGDTGTQELADESEGAAERGQRTPSQQKLHRDSEFSHGVTDAWLHPAAHIIIPAASRRRARTRSAALTPVSSALASESAARLRTSVARSSVECERRADPHRARTRCGRALGAEGAAGEPRSHRRQRSDVRGASRLIFRKAE